MRARYIIESERWSEMKGQSTFDNIEELFAIGLSAVNLADAARVQSTIAELRNACFFTPLPASTGMQKGPA